MMFKRALLISSLLVSLIALSGYSDQPKSQSILEVETSEQTLTASLWLQILGASKREILVSSITYAVQSQVETKKQFESALEEFKSVVDFDGGDLEKIYNRLDKEYDKSKSKANSFRNQIDKVERASQKLFVEWEQEIATYDDYNLRQASSIKLEQTKAECQRLVSAMRQAENRIDPVLVMFYDRVLFLKHNLNAQAIAAIEGDLSVMKLEIDELATEIQKSIDEADRFINNLEN